MKKFLTYKIRLTNSAIKDLKKIPEKDVSLIAKKLNEYKDDPFSFSKKLSGKSISTFRFRVGNYRIIFDIDEDYIVIHRIGNRKDVYR